MTARLKVTMVITGLGTGGAEMMLEKLTLRLTSFDVQVVSLTDLGTIGPRLLQHGVRIQALGMQRGKLGLLAWWRLVQLLRQDKPDVVHTWMYHADLVGGLAARVAGVSAVLWGVRHTNLDPALNKRTTLMVARACAWLSRVVPSRIACVAEVSRDSHIRAGYDGHRMVVIPNGFDLEQFGPDESMRAALRRELAIPGDTPVVLLVGRFDPQKNHRGFARAAAVVLERIPHVRFVLAGLGVGPENSELMAWLDASGVTSACLLLGRRQDVPRLMAAADVLVSPSEGEGFSNVIGEAMACGLPCVVTDVGDSAAIVGSTGYVVARGDMQALGDRVVQVLDLPAAERRQLGMSARERVRTHYELSTVVRQYEREYRTLAEARRIGRNGGR